MNTNSKKVAALLNSLPEQERRVCAAGREIAIRKTVIDHDPLGSPLARQLLAAQLFGARAELAEIRSLRAGLEGYFISEGGDA